MSAENDEIFVAIASYRDLELALTIENCIARADHPERLRFGICLQHDRTGPPEVQPDCLDRIDAVVRSVSYDWGESRGGCWARHRAQGLYEGERFTMQIDSHMRMEPHWDSMLVDMMERFPAAKPLITGQCPLYNRNAGNDMFPSTVPAVPTTVGLEIAPDGWVHHPAIKEPADDVLPRPTRVLSGMFVFTLGQWNIEIRQDPEHLYAGEELALTIRSFTHGYDLFNPERVVAWHRNHPDGNVRYIGVAPDDEVDFRGDRALRRLRVLLRGDPDRVLEPYSTGRERTVDDYCRWAGFDFDSLTIDEAARTGITPPMFRPPSF